ncbi:methylated-DNA--[protein]-cysteine S-methyltransferase, partial [bacterium]|nr:methylated-DNA--[protein]-cysteine S-methyltransferase [bacterium]
IGYGELAKRAGSPGAARAVGRVMAANPLPLLVPCHRVLPSDGGLGGFSATGGAALKARLLHAEGYVFSEELQAGLDHLSRVDRKLGRVIARSGPYLPAFGDREDPYDILVLSIVHQQISMKAAATIAGRVRALTPGADFPVPDEFATLPDDALRGAGLSRQKIGYLRDLAARVGDGRLDLRSLRRLDDDSAIAALTEVKGIGVWTAQMVLIFHFGRLDVWPADDLGLQDAVQAHLGLSARPMPREMHLQGARWAPYRSMASWYLWRTVDGGGV